MKDKNLGTWDILKRAGKTTPREHVIVANMGGGTYMTRCGLVGSATGREVASARKRCSKCLRAGGEARK